MRGGAVRIQYLEIPGDRKEQEDGGSVARQHQLFRGGEGDAYDGAGGCRDGSLLLTRKLIADSAEGGDESLLMLSSRVQRASSLWGGMKKQECIADEGVHRRDQRETREGSVFASQKYYCFPNKVSPLLFKSAICLERESMVSSFRLMSAR